MSENGTRTCDRMDCYVPDTSCAMGHMDEAMCENYTINNQTEDLKVGAEKDEGFPWTGRPMGVVDMRYISSTRRPHVVGIAGAADSGKTTLLCVLFLALYRGHAIGNFKFAGSYTLLGWENISRHMQLTAGDTIQFPPHTSSAGRTPGLLHLRTIGDKDRKQDTLLTDASGEWFSAWTENPSDEQASGARWIVDRADRILIVADTEALIGEKCGVARREQEFLFRRVKHDFGEKNVALLWTKTDLNCPPQIRIEIEQQFKSCFEVCPIFNIGIPTENNNGDIQTLEQLSEIFSWAFSKLPYRVTIKQPKSRVEDPFLSYRGVV